MTGCVLESFHFVGFDSNWVVVGDHIIIIIIIIAINLQELIIRMNNQ